MPLAAFADPKVIEAAKKESELAWWSTIAQDQSQRLVDEFIPMPGNYSSTLYCHRKDRIVAELSTSNAENGSRNPIRPVLSRDLNGSCCIPTALKVRKRVISSTEKYLALIRWNRSSQSLVMHIIYRKHRAYTIKSHSFISRYRTAFGPN